MMSYRCRKRGQLACSALITLEKYWPSFAVGGPEDLSAMAACGLYIWRVTFIS